MTSNSKLSPMQKADLKTLRKFQPDFKVANNGQTTVVYREFRNTVEFALSVASPDEMKFRKKVGEFYARDRVNLNMTQKMNWDDFFCMMDNTLVVKYENV